MFHLIKRERGLFLILFLFLGATKIFACGCGDVPNVSYDSKIKAALKNSAAVFSGKVTGFEFRKGIPGKSSLPPANSSGAHLDDETMIVKFQVAQWWKGGSSPETFLITEITRNSDGTAGRSDCDFDFQKDQSYLVYAFNKSNYLITTDCSSTKIFNDAGEDLKILGAGRDPVEEKKVIKP